MKIAAILGLSLAIFFFYGVHAATFTIKNNCAYTIWPGALTGSGNKLSTTGFELPAKATNAVTVDAPWSGRFWARTGCTTVNGKLTCASADCASGKPECDGAGAIPPASLAEFTLAANNGQDFYDVSLVDGFNIPVSIAPQGGHGDCRSPSCPADINADCMAALQAKGPDGKVVGCKSACLAYNTPEQCCTGAYATPEKCPATDSSRYFKSRCPEAYSYAYDDKTSTVTCIGGPNYVITFCP